MVCRRVRVLFLGFVITVGPVFSQTEVLATAPEQSVTGADVLADAKRIPLAERVEILALPAQVSQLATNLLVRRVLASEATAAGLANDPVMAAALAQARDRILSDALLERVSVSATPANDTLDRLAAASYKAEPERFKAPERVVASHILIAKAPESGLAKANALLAELKNGASFEALAKANSIDTGSAAKGGRLDSFGKGQMVKPFEDAAFALTAAGDLSPVVESQFGYHIIRLESKLLAGLMPFDEVKTALRQEISSRLQQEARANEAARISRTITVDRAAVEAFSAVKR